MAKDRITIVGSSNVDFIMKLPHLPAVGETVTDGQFMQTYGGKGANTAVAAARAGGRTTFITALGDDLYAPRILENFRNDGIDTGRIFTNAGPSTGTALVMFDGRGENYLAVAPGTNDALTPQRVRECEDVIADSAMVLMQMEIPADTILEVLRLARQHGTRVLFNYAPVRGLAVPVGDAMSVLVVNEVEAAALADQAVATVDDAKRVAGVLRQRGPAVVVITLGKQGAVVSAEGLETAVPAMAVQVVDTTAAGDTFCGALAVAMVQGRPLPEAVRFANTAAGLSVTRIGAQPSIPRRDEIDNALARD